MKNIISDFGVIFNHHHPGQDLYIYECGFEVCKPDKPFEFIPIDYYLIHYCISGEGYLRLNNDEKHITAGDIFLIPPNTANKYYPVKDNPWSYRWIGIKGNLAKSFLEDCGLTSNNFVLHYDEDDAVYDSFENIYNYCIKTDNFMAMSNLYNILGILNKKEMKVSEHAQGTGEIYFKKIIDYISIYYFNDITVQSIAEKFNIDRTYVFKLFKKYLNVSPKQYVMNFRIDRACDLLRKSHLDVTEVGYAVGFNSPNYFSKQFAIKMGITPLKYRKMFVGSSQ